MQLHHVELCHLSAVGHRQALAQLRNFLNAAQAVLNVITNRRRPRQTQLSMQALALLQCRDGMGQAILQHTRPRRQQLPRQLAVLRQLLHANL